MMRIKTPISDEVIEKLHIGDKVLLSGLIYTGRDAVLPKLCDLAVNNRIPDNIKLMGSVIFHTAVSRAGVGPTSSNKLEIEGSMPVLSKYGVKIHLGKGQIDNETIKELEKYNSVYAIIPPVTALLNSKTISREIAGFEDLGMEAIYQLQVVEYPVIIAAAHGESIYGR